jgi:hypothetical protein
MTGPFVDKFLPDERVESNGLEGIRVEAAIEHRESCEFCKARLAEGTAEAKFRLLRHVVLFFYPNRRELTVFAMSKWEPCS